MARKHFPRTARSSPKRLTDWLFVDFTGTTLVTGGDATLILLLNALALAMRPFTVIRMHLEYMVRSD